jgi:hypothetical protein
LSLIFEWRKKQKPPEPVIHLDLIAVDIKQAGEALCQFIIDINVEVLNVVGSRASQNERIYSAVFEIVGNIL